MSALLEAVTRTYPSATVTLTFLTLTAYLDAMTTWGKYATAAREDPAHRRWEIDLPAGVIRR